MQQILTLTLLIATFIAGCNQGRKPLDKSEQLKTDQFSDYLFTLKRIDSKKVLDSIKALTDFSMKDTADYIRTPKATLFINDAARTKFQVFEDPKDTITAIVYYRENQKINVAEYYDNGQVMCLFSVSKQGKREGPYECFYKDGSIRINGFYRNNKEVRDSTRLFEKIKYPRPTKYIANVG